MKKTPLLSASELLKNRRTPPTEEAQDEKRKPRRPSTKAGELLHTLRNLSSRRAGPFLRDT